jgi:hypothetical protein
MFPIQPLAILTSQYRQEFLGFFRDLWMSSARASPYPRSLHLCQPPRGAKIIKQFHHIFGLGGLQTVYAIAKL